MTSSMAVRLVCIVLLLVGTGSIVSAKSKETESSTTGIQYHDEHEHHQEPREGKPDADDDEPAELEPLERVSRGLQKSGSVCTADRSLIYDDAWYEKDITISSRLELCCSSNEWKDVKKYLEYELDRIDLWRRFKIVDLNPRLCNSDSRTRKVRRSLAVRDPETLAIKNLIDEDDPLFQQYLEAPEYAEHRRLSILEIVFHLFYRGGEKCNFCREDDGDSNSRRGLSLPESSHQSNTVSLRGANKTLWAQPNSTAMGGFERETLKDHLTSKMRTDLQQSQTLLEERIDARMVELYGNITMDEDIEESDVEMEEWDPKFDHNEEEYGPDNPDNFAEHEEFYRSRGIEAYTDGIFNTTAGRRQLGGCGGCFRLDFNRDGRNRHIRDRRYLSISEYWNSHGVNIRAYAPKCYAPGGKARIFDSEFRHNNGRPDTDEDLGSPNEHCPGGGPKPGRGSGGAPTRNGRTNPGANCKKQGNLLIIQEHRTSMADDCAKGGSIRFDFRYPVKLNKIGLMDVDETKFDFIELYTVHGEKHKHDAKGYGDDSIETIKFNVDDVKTLIVTFPGSGAIRYIDFCHDCGNLDKARKDAVKRFYPSPSKRPYENSNSAKYLDGIIDDLNNAVSTHLTWKVNQKYRSRNGHCLKDQDVAVFYEMKTSTPAGASRCS